jgi:glycosyltransferase involved in cell wall biosynthesis
MSGEVYTWGTPLDRSPIRQAVHAAVRARNRTLRQADAFVAMSRLIRDEFLAAGVDPARVKHLPHGVDTAAFRPALPGERDKLRASLGLGDDDVLVTYTGRLLRGKGLETLVDAFAQALPLQPRLRLMLVGSGAGQALSVEDELRAGVEQRRLQPYVVFTGRVDDVAAHLRASDVFAFPSVYEALGLSLVEAASCGLACVGTRTGGIVDVIEDQENGLLVEPGNAGQLSVALRTLGASGALRARLGASARQTALERFDLERSADAYRALFEELSSRAAAPWGRAAREGAAPPR